MSHTDAPTDVARFEAYVRQVRFVTHAVSNAQDLLPDVPDVLTLQDLSVIRNDFVSPDSQQRYNVFTFANMNTGTRVQDRRSLIIKCVWHVFSLMVFT